MKDNVINWANERKLVKRENATKQVFKLIEESNEIFQGYLKNDVDLIKDGIGDTQVVIIILLKQLSIEKDIKPFSLIFEDIESSLFEFNKAISNAVFSYKYVYRCEKISDSSLCIALGHLKNIAEYYESSLEECLELAWNEIKDRQGITVNGTFIKNQ